MDNQHRQIKGYKELSQAQIDDMNQVKEMAARIGEMITFFELETNTDKRWVAIAKTNLQQGCMALTRAIAKPDFF